MFKFIFKLFSTLILLAILAWFGISYLYPKLQEKSKDSKTNTNEYVLVKRVIDGDTFEITDGGNVVKVRLLGIDTPEMYDSDKLEGDSRESGETREEIKKLGKLSSDYSKKLLLNKKVKLVKEKNYDDKDKYGRLLRYAYLENGILFNKKIIEDGYAYAYRKYPVSKLNEFIEAELEARKKKVGLWGDVEGLKNINPN